MRALPPSRPEWPFAAIIGILAVSSLGATFQADPAILVCVLFAALGWWWTFWLRYGARPGEGKAQFTSRLTPAFIERWARRASATPTGIVALAFPVMAALVFRIEWPNTPIVFLPLGALMATALVFGFWLGGLFHLKALLDAGPGPQNGDEPLPEP